jgi:hypothetical protein
MASQTSVLPRAASMAKRPSTTRVRLASGSTRLGWSVWSTRTCRCGLSSFPRSERQRRPRQRTGTWNLWAQGVAAAEPRLVLGPFFGPTRGTGGTAALLQGTAIFQCAAAVSRTFRR